MSTFGENLRRARRARDLTQTDVADAIGVTKQYVSDVENSTRRAITPDRVGRLAAVLGVTPRTVAEWASGRRERGA